MKIIVIFVLIGTGISQVVEFVGLYDLIDSDSNKFDAFLKETGVGWFIRQIVIYDKSIYNISKEGDYYSLQTQNSFKTTEIKFKFNEPFEEQIADGSKANSTIKRDKNTWIHTQIAENRPKVIMYRHFSAGGIQFIGKVNDVVTIRFYKKRNPKIDKNLYQENQESN